jgi:hypothetical protein
MFKFATIIQGPGQYWASLSFEKDRKTENIGGIGIKDDELIINFTERVLSVGEMNLLFAQLTSQDPTISSKKLQINDRIELTRQQYEAN